MDHTRHLGRCIVVGVGALALSGAGIASATTPPSEPPADTAMETMDTAMGASSEPTTGAGPSDCPAVGAAPSGSEPMSTDAAAGTAPAASEPMTSDAPAATTGDSMAPTESMPAVSGPFVQIAESDEFGPFLVDSECRTLYAFTQDADGEPTCVDDCATNWPPLFVADEAVPALADELDPSLFVVVQHPDGAMVKVGDWPLYYFAGDSAPGDTNGQAVGDVWWLVAPDGAIIQGAAAPTDSAAPEGSAADAPTATDMAPMTTAG